MFPKPILVYFVAALALGAPSAARGDSMDKVELVSGEVFYGQVLRATEAEVSIQLASGGIISFRRHLVLEVRRDGRTERRGEPESSGERPPYASSDPSLGSGAPFQRSGTIPASGSTTFPESVFTPSRIVPHVLSTEENLDDLVIVDVAELDRAQATEPPARAIAAQSATAPSGATDSPTSSPASSPTPSSPSPPTRDSAGDDPRETAAARSPDVGASHGFRFAPPTGFVRSGTTTATEGDGILESFQDPETQASVLISAFQSDRPILEIKNGVLAETLGRFASLQVDRDAAWERNGANGWLVECAGELGGAPLRQVTLFVRSGPRVIVTTFTCPEPLWPRYESSIRASLDGFRTVDSATKTSPAATLSR